MIARSTSRTRPCHMKANTLIQGPEHVADRGKECVRGCHVIVWALGIEKRETGSQDAVTPQADTIMETTSISTSPSLPFHFVLRLCSPMFPELNS